VVIGDRRKFSDGADHPRARGRGAFSDDGGRRGIAPTPEVLAEIQKAVDEVEPHFAQVETVKKFTLLPDRSPSRRRAHPHLKVKRRVVNQNFAQEIEAMYAPATSRSSWRSSSTSTSASRPSSTAT
jgi:long-chain acyl-CoA synthetase